MSTQCTNAAEILRKTLRVVTLLAEFPLSPSFTDPTSTASKTCRQQTVMGQAGHHRPGQRPLTHTELFLLPLTICLHAVQPTLHMCINERSLYRDQSSALFRVLATSLQLSIKLVLLLPLRQIRQRLEVHLGEGQLCKLQLHQTGARAHQGLHSQKRLLLPSPQHRLRVLCLRLQDSAEPLLRCLVDEVENDVWVTGESGLLLYGPMKLRNGAEASPAKPCGASIRMHHAIAWSIGAQLLVVAHHPQDVLQKESHGQNEEPGLSHGILREHLKHPCCTGHARSFIE